jgi:NAD-dependent dihydropyrimidine dehydrogenase PreA subunit
MSKREKFVEIFKVPPAMVPYLDLVVSEQELDLIVGLDDRALTLDQVAEMMGISREEAGQLLGGAFHREIINRETREGVTTYSAGDFYNRMDIWTSYETESWGALPGWVRNAVSEWQLGEWFKLWTPAFEKIAKDPDTWVRMKNRDVLLLEESFELVEATDYICVLPCPCKTTLMPGSRVIEGSMRVGERARLTLERGQGRRLTTEEAKAHLIACDRAGLVHTGLREWKKNDPQLEWMSHGNCSPYYSFPMRAGMRLGLAKKYPRAHYVAGVDWDACVHCGVCMVRCPFGAFYHDGADLWVHGERKRQVKYDAEKCWGCGLCANTCPVEAITMEPLAA